MGPAGPGRAVSLCTKKPFRYIIVPVEPAGPGGAFSPGQYSQNVKAFQPKLMRLISGQGGPHSHNEAVQAVQVEAELKAAKPSSLNRHNYKVGKATNRIYKVGNTTTFINAYLYIYVYVVVSKGTSTPVDSSKGVSTTKNHLYGLVNWLAETLQDVSPIKNI